uniref:Pinin/SDK/MemA protein domain-containing protein n=1 Tax=Populus alba TaxID=43335 RepID=A0A4U5NAM7_POPAL|nr:hypothetical protein D5086_0000272190 [Populus alba]
MKVSGTEAFIQRSIALQRAEQKAHEEHERLRQQECEQIAEQRRRDLTLSARIAVKAEEKKLELLFFRWNDHHKKLSNFIGTKAEPPIYYLPKQPLEKNATLLDQQRELKQIGDRQPGYVEKELERVDSWLEHRTLACGNTIFENQEEERCDEEEHEVKGNYPILGENTEKESEERRCCFTLETTKELAVSQVSHSLRKKSSSFPLRRAKKIPENLEVVSFSPSTPKSVVRDIHGHGGNFRLILFDKGNEI